MDLGFIAAKRRCRMNIKTRLSIRFSLLVFGILIFFSILIYYFSYSSQRSKFLENIQVKAQNTAALLIDVEEVDSTLLKKIHQTTKSFENEEIVITDASNKIIYSNELHDLSSKFMAANSVVENPYYFSIGQKDGVVYKHQTGNQIHTVYVLAYDQYRQENLKDLRNVLLWSILFSVWLSITASYFFSKLAIKPIAKIITNVQEINSSRLNRRLDEGNRKDEIEQLAIKFNEMLANLELAFKNQDEFVSNASHELRTPLAIMIAESDYMISRERDPKEYVEHITGLSGDLRNLNTLINSLLELAHLNKDKSISITDIRIDESVFDAIHVVKLKYPARKIIPRIKYSENEFDFAIKGNSGLLEIALKNLIENACKFSTEDVNIDISTSPKDVYVTISDQGIGIPEEEKNHIFKPFNRATNAKYIGGYGIGLSLVAKIIELHDAELIVTSSETKGTTFKIIFKK